MTAVIGILNKNAVAIAADSAVTVSSGNGRKIYNTANKIFTLSKFHPVSIIIYNSASFLTTPWEIIIKIYRNEIGDKSFPRLRDYSDDFFKFLKKKDFFTTEETIKKSTRSLIYYWFDELSEIALQKAIDNEIDLISLSDKERLKIFRDNILETIDNQTSELIEQEKLIDFKTLSKESFLKTIEGDINEIIAEEFPQYNTKKIKESFSSLVFEHMIRKSFYGPWSGLVFAGYGENDIYPTTISTKISDVFSGKARFYTEHVEKIHDNNNGSIMPFAQRDVIDTLISGISPDIDDTLFSSFNNILRGYNEQIISLLEDKEPILAKKLRSLDIDEICQKFIDSIGEVKLVKHIRPTVDTVSVLSKEDLAEMAESLIYLTYLKRRISSDEESVGGPVDVAIISKGDGFIWIKRKHYFDEKFNPHFRKNYFRN